MGFEQLIEKYATKDSTTGVEYQIDVASNSTPQEDSHNEWQESKPTVALSDFLKSRTDLGVSLVMKDNALTLHFEPGLNKESAERWAFATKAIELLAEAKEDILFMIDWQMLSLPVID